MKNIFKKLFIPSGQKTELVAYNSWVVRWVSLSSYGFTSGGFSISHKPESEIFPSEIDAHKFAEQLRESFKLLKQTGDATKVIVEANQNKLASVPV